jgi:pilus assembly protein Flp/PilA
VRLDTTPHITGGTVPMLNLFTFIQARYMTFKADERGATAVEYGLMVALIAVVIMAAVAGIGTRLNTLFESVKTQIGG